MHECDRPIYINTHVDSHPHDGRYSISTGARSVVTRNPSFRREKKSVSKLRSQGGFGGGVLCRHIERETRERTRPALCTDPHM